MIVMASASNPTQKQGDTLVGRAWNAQDRLEARIANLGKGRYIRVLKMARKPTADEFRKASTVSAIGLGILGFLGFLVFFLMEFIPQ